MRIKLKISRNELPTTKILYNLPNEPLTFSAFLERVNELVPLEADGWGLDDYVAEVNGFECLHYYNVADILSAEDEVSIRPLRSSDIKARRLSGRYQINAAGAHLIDGIAFGSQYLKRPNRPPISIPPRKRRRVSYDVEEITPVGSPSGPSPRSLRIRSTFEDADAEQIAREGRSSRSTGREEDTDSKHRSKKRRRSVSFAESVREEDDDDEDEEDYTPSSDSNSDYDSSSESDYLEAEAIRLEEGKIQGDEDNGSVIHHSSDAESNAGTSSDSSSSSSGSSSDISSDESSSDEDSDSEGEDTSTLSYPSAEKNSDTSLSTGKPSKTPKQKQTQDQPPPGKGMTKTQKRNERRRNKGQILALISQGLLPKGATKLDLQSYLGQSSKHGAEIDTPSTGQNNGRVEDVAAQEGEDEEIPPTSFSGKADGEHATELETPASVVPQRHRLDQNSARRLIFHGLGVRNPKTKDEEEKLRAKLAAKPTRTATKAFLEQEKKKSAQDDTVATAGQVDESSSPAKVGVTETLVSDDWKGKIKLLAVECCDEGIELSTPPFPFVQRWDPQQQSDYHHRPKGKKRKRATNATQCSTALEEFTDETGHMLDYDDEAYLSQDVIKDSQEDDLPPLPQDVSALLDLSQADIKPGAVVAFKYLEMSQSTNWQPLISEKHRTALVEGYDESTNLFQLTLAWRDRSNRTEDYDDEGNRVFGKFEMPADDYTYDDGKLELAFDAMIEPKLVAGSADVDIEGPQNSEDLSPIMIPNSVGLDNPALEESQSSSSFIGPMRPSTTTDEGESLAVLRDSNGAELPAAQRPDPSVSDSIPSNTGRTKRDNDSQNSLSKALGMIEASA